MKLFPKAFILCGLSLFLHSCGPEGSETSEAEAASSQLDSLFSAAAANDVELLNKLLKSEVDLSATDGAGNTALHSAAETGALETAKLLIQAGADIDAQKSNGQTPLLVATTQAKIEMVRMLLRQNASAEIKDNRGYRALTVAAEAGNTEAVEALAIYSRNYLDDALFLASIRGHSEMIDVLTNYGASVYSRLDKDGRTPLMMAASNGRAEAVRVLLENGANRYSTDEQGMTASEIALAQGHGSIADYLGETPKKKEFRFAGQDENAIETAVKQVVAIERQVPVSTGETPLSDTSLKVIALNGRQLNTEASKPIEDTLSFKTYREETLPIQVAGVDDKKISIKYLYGDHQRLELYPGDTIPETNLKVVSAEAKRDTSKMSSAGIPADVSEIMVEDVSTGQRRKMTAGLNVGRSEPFAVVKEYSSDSLLVAKQGDVFRKADGKEYEVLEVRSTQLVLMDSASGNVHTVKK